jgi:predicted Ser/Thr protein kinase
MSLAADPSDPLLATLREHLAAEYEVEGELGRGAMGVVYRATERELHRAVALKVLPPALATTSAIAERFKREARLMASLDHPNVMPVYRVGQAGGVPFMTMKLVEGRSLEAILAEQGALPLPVVVVVLRAASAALAAAHDRGIVHRDVKGGNILVDRDGRILVTDFGIARAADDGSLTATSTIVGTPYFMSPEQCAGKRVGPASDQYSLGILAFQMLSGSVPFEADSLAGIMHHHFFTPAPDLGLVRDGLPRPLLDVVERALAKEPERRFASTRDMVDALDAVPLEVAERREGEAALRALARGDVVPRVPATALHAAPTVPSGERAAPRPLWGGTLARRLAGQPMALRTKLLLGVLALVLLLGGALAVRETRSADAAVRRGVRHYASGDKAAAAAAFERAVAADPRLALPHVYLGRIAREQGDLARATRELRAAIELEPRHAAALREMGALQLSAGRADLARSFYVRALEVEPDDRAAQGYLGCALARLGRTAEASRFLARAGSGPWSGCAATRAR